MSIVIGQPVGLAMVNHLDIGIIPAKAILVPNQHLLNLIKCIKMSRCDFGGMIILPAKITLLQFEWMLTICQLNSLTGDYTYFHRIMYL